MKAARLLVRALLSLLAFLLVVASLPVLFIALGEKNLLVVLMSAAVFVVASYGLLTLSSAEYRERMETDSEML